MLTDQQQTALRRALQRGLPICEQPYTVLAAELGMSESQVLDTIAQWRQQGLIKRFGAIVRHQELGYQANAMVVWDVPDTEVDAVGERLGQNAEVTLSYRRARRQPDWPYNLFCMIHGKDRNQVLAILEAIIERQHLGEYPHRVLFSTRRFKQQGADYVGTGPIAATTCCTE